MTRRLFRTVSVLALAAASAAAADKKIIQPPSLGRPAGTPVLFSPGVLIDGTLYISGMMGADVATGQIPDAFEDELKRALDHAGVVLKAADMTYEDVVAVTVYLSDMDLFQRMNAVYATYFKEPRPTRSTVGVARLALPKGRVEITITARK